jgi:hypothetical protein
MFGGAYGTAPLGRDFRPAVPRAHRRPLFPLPGRDGRAVPDRRRLLFLATGAAEAGNGKLMVTWLFLGHMLCYMPTLGLSNTIAFQHP